MKESLLRNVRLAYYEIIFLVYEIYSEIKVTVILTVKEVVLSILQ